MTLEVLHYVRQWFAREFKVPSDKVLPGDDMAWFFDVAELDMSDEIKEWETRFKIVINQDDAAVRRWSTVRGIATVIKRSVDRHRLADKMKNSPLPAELEKKFVATEHRTQSSDAMVAPADIREDVEDREPRPTPLDLRPQRTNTG